MESKSRSRIRVFLLAVVLGACASHKKVSVKDTPIPAASNSFSQSGSTQTYSVGNIAGLQGPPATCYTHHAALSARYIEALITDPALVLAYEGYYPKQNQPLNKIWANFKHTADSVTRLVSVVPAAQIGVGAYRSLTKAESMVKKELSQDEKVAFEVEEDIALATAKVAREVGARLILDVEGSSVVYLDPSLDCTEHILATLLQFKKDQLAVPKSNSKPALH